jgi:hypothetical protein
MRRQWHTMRSVHGSQVTIVTVAVDMGGQADLGKPADQLKRACKCWQDIETQFQPHYAIGNGTLCQSFLFGPIQHQSINDRLCVAPSAEVAKSPRCGNAER